MLLQRKPLWSFYLHNEPYKYKLCLGYIDEAEESDKMLRQNVENTTDSYWLRTLNMAIEKAKDGKGTSYAADIDASLFTPDSKNPWWITRACDFCSQGGEKIAGFDEVFNCIEKK